MTQDRKSVDNLKNRFFHHNNHVVSLVYGPVIENKARQNRAYIQIQSLMLNADLIQLTTLLGTNIPELIPSITDIIAGYILNEAVSKLPITSDTYKKLHQTETVEEFMQEIQSIYPSGTLPENAQTVLRLLKHNNTSDISWMTCGEKISFVELRCVFGMDFNANFQLIKMIRRYPDAIVMARIGHQNQLITEPQGPNEVKNLFPNGLPTCAMDYNAQQRQFVSQYGISCLPYTNERSIYNAGERHLQVRDGADLFYQFLQLFKNTGITHAQMIAQQNVQVVFVNDLHPCTSFEESFKAPLNDNISYQESVDATPCYELQHGHLKVYLQLRFIHDEKLHVDTGHVSLSLENQRTREMMGICYQENRLTGLLDVNDFLAQNRTADINWVIFVLKHRKMKESPTAKKMLDLILQQGNVKQDQWKLYEPAQNRFGMYQSAMVTETKVDKTEKLVNRGQGI